MAEKEKPCCDVCRYFVRYHDSIAHHHTGNGECRVEPPQVIGDRVDTACSTWPVVYRNEWCGRFWHL